MRQPPSPTLEPYLAPCPFCGEQPTIEPWGGVDPDKHLVCCCGDVCNVIPSVTGESEQEAADHWNSRAAAPETAAERDRLVVDCDNFKTLATRINARCDRLLKDNEGLVKALEKITQIQRDKCENASAEMLFILLDNKVDIAQAALTEARQP